MRLQTPDHAAASILVRKRSILPALRERQALADSLARHLAQLGLERRAREIPTLKDYLASRPKVGPGSGAAG